MIHVIKADDSGRNRRLCVPAQLPVHACAATCSCLRSYLFIPSQLSVRACAATNLNLHGDIIVVLRLRTFEVASAHSRACECALSGPRARSRGTTCICPLLYGHFHFFISLLCHSFPPYLFFRPPFIRHSVIFPNKVVKYKWIKCKKS